MKLALYNISESDRLLGPAIPISSHMRPNSEHNPLHGSSGWGTSDGPSQRPVASSGGARLGEGGVEGADRRSAYDNAPSESQRGHKVGVWMLVGLIYYSVSGGPLGVEVAVRAGGPALALLGFLVMPVIWSAPEALMTAELSVAYPEAAGFSAWTNAAFGPFWSFMCSILSWFSGVLDNAVYPVLMLEYVLVARKFCHGSVFLLFFSHRSRWHSHASALPHRCHNHHCGISAVAIIQIFIHVPTYLPTGTFKTTRK